MRPDRPLSDTSLAVLQAVADGSPFGFDIMDATGLPSGTVYPILGRLAKAGLVTSRWEQSNIAHREKRPPRRYYSVTDRGAKSLAASLAYQQAMAAATAGGALEPRKA